MKVEYTAKVFFTVKMWNKYLLAMKVVLLEYLNTPRSPRANPIIGNVRCSNTSCPAYVSFGRHAIEGARNGVNWVTHGYGYKCINTMDTISVIYIYISKYRQAIPSVNWYTRGNWSSTDQLTTLVSKSMKGWICWQVKREDCGKDLYKVKYKI